MTPHEALSTLTRAVDDQPLWHLNRQHGYAYHLHGRHIATITPTAPEVTATWAYRVHDVLTGAPTVHGHRAGEPTTLLEEMNVALSEAERRHADRARD